MNLDPRSPRRQRGPAIQSARIKLEGYNLVPGRVREVVMVLQATT